MTTIQLAKKALSFLLVGFIVSGIVFGVFVGSVSAASGDYYYWSYGSTNFDNHSTVTSYSGYVAGYGCIRSSVTEPQGYLGARADVLTDSYVKKATGPWVYTSSATSVISTRHDYNSPSNGYYCAQGETRYYRSGSYLGMWCYVSANEKYPK